VEIVKYSSVRGMQANTFWGLSMSPYVIQRPITVSRGATLSIAAGVHVVFADANSRLTVAGRLSSRLSDWHFCQNKALLSVITFTYYVLP